MRSAIRKRVRPWLGVIVWLFLIVGLVAGSYAAIRQEVVRFDWHSALSRILTLVSFVVGFCLVFAILDEGWDLQKGSPSWILGRILKVAILKSFRIWFLITFLVAGITMLLEPYPVKVGTLEAGVIAALCVVIDDNSRSWREFNEIMHEVVIGLAVVVILVNIFVTVPLPYPYPAIAMGVVAVGATALDLLIYCVGKVVKKRGSIYLSKHGISWS